METQGIAIPIIESVAHMLECCAVVIVTFSFIHASIRALLQFWQKRKDAWDNLRLYIGKALQLALEFLIAADIITTVLIKPTREGIISLGLLILVRTFLSWSITVEVEGCWPWQLAKNKKRLNPMEDIFQRIVDNIFRRLDGPLHFRFIVQPLIAIMFAILDGMKDAKKGKPAYFWALIVNPEHCKELLKDGWKHVGKIFILAVVLDIIYQLKVFNKIYPGEIFIVALLLAVLPYLLLRGPINRIMSKRRENKE